MTSIHRYRLLAVCLFIALVAGGAFMLRARRTAPTGADAPRLRYAISLPRGTELEYAVEWTSTSDLELATAGGGKVHGLVDVAARLLLRSQGKVGEVFLVGVQLSRFTRHKLSILGSEALPDDDATRKIFDGSEALAEIDAAGRVRAVRFRKDDPEVFKQVVRTLLADAQVSVEAEDESAWTAREVTSTGEVESSYTVLAARPPKLCRKRSAYLSLAALHGSRSDQRLVSSATIELSLDGHIASLTSEESLQVGTELAQDTRVAMRLVAERQWSSPASPATAMVERRATGEVVSSPDARQQMLDQQIAGLSAPQMEFDLMELVHTGSLPGGSGWLLRASGLLKAQPEACLDLVTLFQSDEMNARGRTQIIDLLAGTGTTEAQHAMRLALASSAARRDGAYGALLQRFSSVQRPTEETLAFVLNAYRATSGSEHIAAAYALGATGGHALARGDERAAQSARNELGSALDGARTPEERRHLALALGNVGHPGDAPVLARLARDEDADVRASAAWAMRDLDVRAARATLIELSADKEPRVAESALRAMTRLHLENDEVKALTDQAKSGAVPAMADGALLAILSPHANLGTPVREALTQMLERHAPDKPMQARIRAVLSRTAQ